MNIRRIRSLRSIRILLVTSALLFVSTFGFAAGNASADVLVPAVSTGGSGGGGGSAEAVDQEWAFDDMVSGVRVS